MAFAAISYPVREGFEDRIAEIFSAGNFQRVDSPVMEDEDGEITGFLIATGLFVQGGTIVRIIQHEGGTAADIARHMSDQDGVHAAERALMPYLPEPRDTESSEGFRAHFFRSLLTEVEQYALDNRPAAGLMVLRYPIRADAGDELAARLEAREFGRVLRPGKAGIVRTALFLSPGRFVLRVVQHEGDERAALRCLATADGGQVDSWLDPLLPPGSPSTAGAVPMRAVSFLSAAVTG